MQSVKSTSPVTENHGKNSYVNYTTFTRTLSCPMRTAIMTPSTPTRMKRTITTRAICTSEHSSAPLVVFHVSLMMCHTTLAQVVHVSVTPSSRQVAHVWFSDLFDFPFYFNLSFSVFFLSSVLMHPDLHTDLDNLDTV